MDNKDKSEYRIDYFLSAGECNAQSVIPLPMLVQRVIEVSTMHANSVDIGYSRLHGLGMAWVLSRISLEMTRYPGINENFSLVTWVETINRHFSERNIEVIDGEGKTIGYARTIWVAIDMGTRRGADMSVFMDDVVKSDRLCPIARQPKLPAVDEPDMVKVHQFQYCDIDFNRHVNSTRYVDAILNQWGVEFFDHNMVRRFDIAFMAETHYDDVIDVKLKNTENCSNVELTRNGKACCRARIAFENI